MDAIKMRDRLRELHDKLIPEARRKHGDAQRNLSMLEKESVMLTTALAPRAKAEPTISDHALIRYMERAMGLNLDDIRSKMLTPTNTEAIKAGCTAITVDGVKFKVHGNTIVTVL